jgi:hypothetical protein
MRLRIVVPCTLSACLLTVALPLAAQSASARDSVRDDAKFSFYARGPYRPNVPKPESILGYDVGTFNTQFALQEKTLLAIADAAKDRVRVEEIGSTNERRTMRLYIISSPENIQRLDAIRADLDRVADPRGATQADLDAVVARVPAVVWINESVHGNESPGFETAMQTLYHFAASEEPATLAALRNALIILNPSTNPDGHERFTVWYNSINVNSPEPASLEKDEPWSIQGRFNHYRFDMNRDVMTSTQREVQALVRAQVKWHPMVAIDQHGQVGTYFFPPTAPALNPNLDADFVRWMEIYGKANAAAFDRYGWMYYSRDVFDFYGPFYWDSWPSLMGAIGMTYETDGGGWKGHVWRREDGSLLTLRDGVAKHFTTALATVFATADRRAERVRDFLAFRQRAVADGRTGTLKRVVLPPGDDPGRTAELVTALLRSGIEVRRTTAPFTATRAHAYADDAVSSRRFDAGAYVIDMSQPQGRMAKAFLEAAPPLDTAFARTQIDKFKRNTRRGSNENREGYEFYDVTAWSLPVTFGVEAYWTEDAAPVTGELLVAPPEDRPGQPGPASPRRIGGELLAVDVKGGIVSGRPAQSAYVFGPERNGASRLAFHLLRENYRVAVTTTPIEAGARTWPRGTYIVRVARNDSTIHARLDALARESGVEVVGVNSAATDSRQFGIGSENVVALVTPKVALVGDDGVSQTGYGAVWWTLEHRYGIPFTPIALGVLSGGNLSAYNVIIIPDASPGALNGRLGKAGADRLREWARAGGTLITMGGATGWAAREDVNLTSARAVVRDTATKPAVAKTDSVTAENRARERTPDRTQPDLLAVTSPTASAEDPAGLPGSHFDTVLDRTHWLTHGYERPRLTVMLDGSRFLKLSKEGTNVAVFPSTGTLHRSGFVFPDNTERLLRGTALLVDEPTGAGHVVLFNNEPMFRAWWRSLDRIVLNAIVLGPAM